MLMISRRNFLKIAYQGLLGLSGLLGLGGLIRFLSYEPDPPPPTQFIVGSETNFPMNSRTVLPEIPAVLIRTESGFVALSLVCTHLSCTAEVKPTGFVCPCHGSQYDKQGNVTRGPAGIPLQKLVVELTADKNLVVYRN
jgi:Rieske Fe-S protein